MFEMHAHLFGLCLFPATLKWFCASCICIVEQQLLLCGMRPEGRRGCFARAKLLVYSSYGRVRLAACTAASVGQRVRVYGDAIDTKRVLGPVLLVHLDSLHLGERGEAVVANDLAKDSVEAVQVRRLVEHDKELGAVGAGPLVGHGDDAAVGMAQRGPNLVVKGAAPDGAAALGVLGRRGLGGPAGLDHELGDEAVEGGLVVVARRA